MFSTKTPRRVSTAGKRPRKGVQPRLENLEDRMLLYATYGGTWVYGQRITYSFAPDGTDIGGVPSNLFATMNKVAPTATWQAAFQKAAAVWSSSANINLSQVSDNGEMYGAAGNQQDDPNVGDIRIGMIPQSSGTLSITFLPPPANGGTLAGDMVFNSNQYWGINTGADIETVALHEFGHALGLGENTTDPSTVMYQSYTGMKTTLAPDDLNGIHYLWGAYPADLGANLTFATATDLTPLIGPNAQIALPGQSLAGYGDFDWYKATVPSTTDGTMVITLQSANLSSATLHLAVENSAGRVLGQSSSRLYGSTVSYTVNGVSANQTYYFRASAQLNPGFYGAYGVLVNFGNQPQAPIAPPNTVVASQPDQGSGFDYLHDTGRSGPSSWAQGPGLEVAPDLSLGNLSTRGDTMTIDPSLLKILTTAVSDANSSLGLSASTLIGTFAPILGTIDPGLFSTASPTPPTPTTPFVSPVLLDSALTGLGQGSSDALDQLAASLVGNKGNHS